jgi:hypothetical protein
MTDNGPLFARSAGEVVELETAEAWTTWCKQYAPGRARELVWAEDVNRMECTIAYLKAGRVQVSISVSARQPWKSDKYYAHYQHLGDGRLELVRRV